MPINSNNIINRVGGVINNNLQSFSKSLTRISTGNRVNSAADNASGLIISEQLQSEISAMEQAIKNAETDISLLQTADAAMEEISVLLQNIKQIALNSANSAVNDVHKQYFNQKEVQTLTESINQIIDQTKFGERRLIDGSSGLSGVTTGKYLQFISGTEKTAEYPTTGVAVKIYQRPTQSFWIAKDKLEAVKLVPDSTLKVIENGKVAEYIVNKDDTPASVIANLQRVIDSIGLGVVVDKNPAGRLLLYSKEYGSKKIFQVSSSIDGVLSDKALEINSATAGLNVKGEVDGVNLEGDGQFLYGVENTPSAGLVLRYSYDQTDLANPAPLDELGGYLSTKQNSMYFQNYHTYGGGFKFGIEDLSPENLGRKALNTNGYKNLAEIDVSTEKNAQSSILVIDDALNQVLAQRARSAITQKSRLEASVNYLLNARENLVSAVSTIKDTDYAEEIINNIKSQLNIAYSSWSLNKAVQVQNSIKNIINAETNNVRNI